MGNKGKHNNKKQDNRKQETNLSSPLEVKLVKEKGWSKSDIIGVCALVTAIVSIILSIFTNYRMVGDRNAAYFPDIMINPYNYVYEWDNNGYPTWIEFNGKSVETTIEEPDENGIVKGHISISMTLLSQSSLFDIPVTNIGVGSAKEITMEWDDGNNQRIMDYLIDMDEKYKSFCTLGPVSSSFQFDDYLVLVDNCKDSNYKYMLPSSQAKDADELYYLRFPTTYILLLNEIIRTGALKNNDVNIPAVVLKMDYEDIHNTEYTNYILFNLYCISYNINEDGSGKAEYQIVPQYGE